jgi:hypothetical protein
MQPCEPPFRVVGIGDQLTPAATKKVIDGVPPEIVHETRMWVSPANGPATDANCEPIAVNAFDVMRVVAEEKPTLSSVWIVNVIVGVDVPDKASTWNVAQID